MHINIFVCLWFMFVLIFGKFTPCHMLAKQETVMRKNMVTASWTHPRSSFGCLHLLLASTMGCVYLTNPNLKRIYLCLVKTEITNFSFIKPPLFFKSNKRNHSTSPFMPR
ncbi:unnamed protein product [Tenebrio molitor]|nr:unnamed protein product [Tenebrio molitor]